MGTLSSAPRRAVVSASLSTLCLLAALSSAACEPRVSLGAICSVSSDCESPYVCAAGRCRVECSEARDCTFPLECLVVGNASGCRVPEEGPCPRGVDDCAPGLECISGRCAQPCEDHDECAAAQTCGAAGCDRPPVATGTCDALSGAGCEAGQRCNAAGTCEASSVMVSLIQNEVFGACDATHPCRDGLDCREGRCLRLCRLDDAGDPLSSCGVGSRCRSSDERGVPAPAGLGWCTQPCDPLDPASCPAGLGCGVDFLNGNVTQTSCEVVITPDCEAEPSADGCAFSRCDATNRCVSGTDCLDTLSRGDLTPALCLPFCDESEVCPTYSTCVHGRFSVHYTVDGVMYERGLCMPSCDVAEGTCATPDELDIACDDTHPIEGTTALCTQGCLTDADCFPSLFVCDTTSGRCTPNRS
jgi:hypothetical protein